MRYAATTSVGADRSRAEIERTLQRYGATGFLYGWKDSQAIIGFHMQNRQIKFVLQMPDKQDECFWTTPGRHRRRRESQAYAAWEQATRQRWRALSLAVKAKLEAVDAGIASFETEFMPYIVLPGGTTVGDFMVPQIEKAYLTGKVPKMLPALTEGTQP
jgi:hypothetical protein